MYCPHQRGRLCNLLEVMFGKEKGRRGARVGGEENQGEGVCNFMQRGVKASRGRSPGDMIRKKRGNNTWCRNPGMPGRGEAMQGPWGRCMAGVSEA